MELLGQIKYTCWIFKQAMFASQRVSIDCLVVIFIAFHSHISVATIIGQVFTQVILPDSSNDLTV
jgi:hypothetical protein